MHSACPSVARAVGDVFVPASVRLDRWLGLGREGRHREQDPPIRDWTPRFGLEACGTVGRRAILLPRLLIAGGEGRSRRAERSLFRGGLGCPKGAMCCSFGPSAPCTCDSVWCCCLTCDRHLRRRWPTRIGAASFREDAVAHSGRVEPAQVGEHSARSWVHPGAARSSSATEAAGRAILGRSLCGPGISAGGHRWGWSNVGAIAGFVQGHLPDQDKQEPRGKN